MTPAPELTERDKAELRDAQLRVSPLTLRIERAVQQILARHLETA